MVTHHFKKKWGCFTFKSNACPYFRSMNSKRNFSIIFFLLIFGSTPFVFSLIKSGKAPAKFAIKNDVDADKWATEKLSNMSLDEKIGQFFMVSAYSNQGEKHLKEVESLVTNEKVGGIIFFQGEKANLVSSINRFQSVAKVPLLIGMDAEWGTNMRLFDGERFPFAYTIGAADDVVLSEKIASMMAFECQEMGIHINFAPVADVNSNPKNPVIGFRSFGENPKKVADHVKAFVRGMEGNGVMTSIKHFPGHGNTDADSHFELPTVTESLKTIEAINFYPFQEGIRVGSSSVMVGHLNVPALDNSGTPSSLSKKIIGDYLIKQMGFQGLIISDALNMKAVADKYGKTEVVVKAFEAGCDILLFPESVNEAINAIKTKVEKGQISKTEIDERCLKILKAKYKFVVAPKKATEFSKTEMDLAKKEVYEKAVTVLKNDSDILPLKRLDKKIAHVSIGIHTTSFRESLDLFADVDHFQYFTAGEAITAFSKVSGQYDVIIVALHSGTVRPVNNFGYGNDLNNFITSSPSNKETVLVVFGNPLVLQNNTDLSTVDAVMVGYENNALLQKTVGQMIFGAVPMVGNLPITVTDLYPREHGIQVKWGGRLKFSQPEELGISIQKLKEIDQIAENAIKKGAFPGCQIVVAVEGKIIYRKSFGTQQYESKDSVRNTDLYDIASVSKIAGSTVGIMKLQTDDKFSLSKNLSDYIPEVTGNGSFGSILIRDMMAHQAGLTAWIPFYKRTLKNGELNTDIYSKTQKSGFDAQVAQDIWIKNGFSDSIYKQILATSLGTKKYEYSDLGYYFIKKIIEKQAGQAFQDYLMQQFYLPMGLRSMRYQPRNYYPLDRIVPTENDKVFRKQLVHGYVHDPGAAMLGGIGGHAGLFSNATDLASLMQLILNKGRYGNVNYIKPEVVEEFTKAQFAGNRRGAGFDRPSPGGGGPCYDGASQLSFGHSGFTGTLVWSDPKYDINYVFLSNRVCPDQDNWKIRDMSIRTEIQKVIYEAVLARTK
jgi:beta-glucosidase-like glycosyl hydrolase/CubicO group peptidase (beta-lactamase class C family)